MSPLEIALIVMVVMFIIGMPIYMSLCIAAAVTLVCGDILRSPSSTTPSLTA